jgi:hypothetical protein
MAQPQAEGSHDFASRAASDSHIARASQAPHAGDAGEEKGLRRAVRQPCIEQPLNALGRLSTRKADEFSPELDRIALGAQGHRAQIRMALFEHERLAARSKRSGIAFEHGRRRGAVVNGEEVLSLGEHGARDQPHEIDGIGHAGDFIEIVDAPNESALGIPPGAEVLNVEIADRNQSGRIG